MAGGQTSLWDDLLNQLEAALGIKTDPDSMVQQVSPYWTQLLGLAEDLSNTMPPGTDLWIVPEGDSDGVNTMTLGEFSTAVANSLAAAASQPSPLARGRRGTRAAGGTEPIDPVKFAEQLLGMLKSLQKFIDPELWLRYTFNLKGTLTAANVASSVAAAINDISTFDQSVEGMGWQPDQPDSDADKESWEVISGLLPVADLKVISQALNLLPFAERTADWDIGNRVHRWVMAKYVEAHQDHLVIIDGSARWPIVTEGGGTATAMGRLKDAFKGSKDDLTGDMADRIAHYNAQMWGGQDGKTRIRPDIADLAPTATGLDPTQDHGWFEIKPYNGMLTALGELNLLYMTLWNAPVGNPFWKDDWTAANGTWFPPLFYVDKASKSLCVLLNIPPGVISYAIFAVDIEGDVILAGIVAGLLSKFVQKLLQDLKRQMETLAEAAGEIALSLVKIALLAALVILAILAFIGVIELGTVSAVVAVVVAVIGSALKNLSDPSKSSGT